MAERSDSFVPADRYQYKLVQDGENVDSTKRSKSPFFNAVVFTTLTSLANIAFAANMTYLGAVLGTIEKRFQLKSTESGMFFTVNDVVGLSTVLIITHLGHKTSRPKVICVLYILFTVACFMHAIPQFIYELPASLRLTQYQNSSNNEMQTVMCDAASNDEKAVCSEKDKFESGSLMKQAWWIILAQALIGLTSAIAPLTITFIDDNQKKKNTPIYVAVVFSSYTIGIVVGFFLATFCLSLPVTFPNVDPESDVVDPRDPRFIGAWWLGFLICGFFTSLFGLPLMFFPRKLPGENDIVTNGTNTNSDGEVGIVKEFCESMWRIVTNIPVMFIIFTTCASICGFVGLRTFGTKYMHTQFDVPPARAAMVVGIVIIPCAVFGNLLSGYIVKKLKLSTRGMATMLCILSTLGLISLPAFFFVGCPKGNIAGLTVDYPHSHNTIPDLNAVCNQNCSCPPMYRPVCGFDGISYASACHAGCTEESIVERDGENKTMFDSCACIDSDMGEPTAQSGSCSRGCSYIPHIILALCFSTFGSLSPNPAIMIKLRSVEDRDKPLVLGFTNVLLKVFAYIPGPVYWGAVIDSACLLYQESCGKTGNCIVYDTDQFRINFYSMSLGFKAIDLLCVTIVLIALIAKGRQKYSAGQEKRRNEHIFKNGNQIDKTSV